MPLMFLNIKLTDLLKVDSSGLELKFSNSIRGLNSEKVSIRGNHSCTNFMANKSLMQNKLLSTLQSL